MSGTRPQPAPSRVTREHRRLTPDQIAGQRGGGTRLAPGLWVDRSGDLHISLIELLELFDMPDTPATREEVSQIAYAMLEETFPGLPIVVQE